MRSRRFAPAERGDAAVSPRLKPGALAAQRAATPPSGKEVRTMRVDMPQRESNIYGAALIDIIDSWVLPA